MKINRKHRIISLFLLAVILISATACAGKEKSPKSKKAVDEARFAEVAEKHEFEVTILDTRPDDLPGLTTWCAGADEPLRIHFMTYDTAEHAQAYLDRLKDVNSKRSNTDSEITMGDNYEFYTITIGNAYAVVSRVDRTVFHAMGTKDDIKRIDEVLTDLGY